MWRWIAELAWNRYKSFSLRGNCDGLATQLGCRSIDYLVRCNTRRGRGTRGGPRKRYKDHTKATLKQCSIPSDTLEAVATDRAQWCTACEAGLVTYYQKPLAVAEARREQRIWPPSPAAAFICNIYDRACKLRIDLSSHERMLQRARHRPQWHSSQQYRGTGRGERNSGVIVDYDGLL